MNRCPNCNFENTPASTYCERCGAPLAPSSSPLEPTYRTPSEDSIPIPPPPPGYAEALPPTLYQYPSSAIRQQRRQHKRTIGGTILSSLLYLWGAFCFSFGFAGGVLQGTSNEIVALTFIGFCIASLIFLIPLLLYRRRFRLRWGARLLLEIGLVFAGFLMLGVVTVVLRPAPPYTAPSYEHALGSVFLIYGLAAAVVAFW